jgi:ribosome-binding factor A
LNMIDCLIFYIYFFKVTPDLLEARIYLSLFQVKDPKTILKRVEDRSWEIKKELASRVKQQLRRIPELKFFEDDTLENAFKMEELFKQINKGKEPEA